MVFCAAVKSDGTLLNPEAEPKPRTTAREFETVNLRYWAAWSKSYKQSLFYTTLEKTAEGDSYKLRAGPAINALLGTEINFPWTDAAPFGEGGQYDVSTTGIVLATLDPSVTPADFLLSEVWYVPLTTFTESPAPEVRLIKPSAAAACDGSSESPVFSPDGRKIAFLKGTDRKRLWHCPRRIFIASTDTTDDARLLKLLDPSSDGQDWDYWPGSLMWSNDAKTIYFDAEVRAYRRLFRIALPQEQDGGIAAKPMPLTETGSVVAMHRMGHTDTTLLLTLTSFIDSSTFVTLSSSSEDVQILSSASENGRLFGMSPSQVTQFTIPVADYSVQSWLITPPTMDPTRKYPLAISIHGGPQVGLLDAWSTRWNLLLLAAQGFVVLVPNFSGSSSFGEGFANVVDQGWGGRPYDDVVACFEHAVKEHSFIDADRVVAMGGSYGGYLVNWLAGQPFASRVRALVCHNGIWNLPGMYAGDVPSTLRYDLLGEWWENRQHWDKYDPAQYVQNWKTPMLFIHSDNDFRYAVTNPHPARLAPLTECKMSAGARHRPIYDLPSPRHPLTIPVSDGPHPISSRPLAREILSRPRLAAN